MSVVLLMGSGLLVREFVVLARMEPRFARDVVGQVGLAPRMQGTFAEAEQGAYTRTFLERVEGLPEVEAAAYSSEPVPAGRDAGWLDTVALRNGQGEALATLVAVSPGFFRTLRMAMARGWDFEWNDVAGGVAVALADENLARRLGGEVVGKRVRFGVQPEFQELELVGVARSARVIDPRDGRMPVIYVPVLQRALCENCSHLRACSSSQRCDFHPRKLANGRSPGTAMPGCSVGDLCGGSALTSRSYSEMSSFSEEVTPPWFRYDTRQHRAADTLMASSLVRSFRSRQLTYGRCQPPLATY